MRLTDADILIKDLLHEAAHQALIGNPENARGLKYAAEYMKLQPTAYDVDKVLQELGDLRDTTINTEYAPCETYGTNCVDKAIEIVKGAVQHE